MKRNASRTLVALVTAAGIAMAGAACSSSHSSSKGSTGGNNDSGGVADGKPLDPNATVTITIDLQKAGGGWRVVNLKAARETPPVTSFYYPLVTTTVGQTP